MVAGELVVRCRTEERDRVHVLSRFFLLHESITGRQRARHVAQSKALGDDQHIGPTRVHVTVEAMN